MNTNTTVPVTTALLEMRRATEQLARGSTYLSTAKAVALSPIPITDESLLDYPEYVMPRIVKNARAKRPTYLWDPRDLLALPVVLRRWEQARRQGAAAVEDFQRQRIAQLEERDLQVLALAGTGAE